MRPLMNPEEVGRATPVEKTSLKDVQEVWNLWEIHCLILLSLFLQVVLFLFAGVRRRSSSSILRGLLWLAYLSADSVAIFVLGRLMVHAQEPHHQLMYFWALFILVHLGGQDTITAFSKQDNELWRRHLLSLVTQAAVAIYAVTKASWPDARLRAAMVILFISGCFKYAERTVSLYNSTPQNLSSVSVSRLLIALRELSHMNTLVQDEKNRVTESANVDMIATLNLMSEGSCYSIYKAVEILSEDAPKTTATNILIADDISDMLRGFKSRTDRCGAYKCVGACLAECYEMLHTKAALRADILELITISITKLFSRRPLEVSRFFYPFFTLILLYTVFQLASAPLALTLFVAAEKGDQHHTSRHDIKVTYVLLIGAILLDVCSSLSSMRHLPDGRIKGAVLRVANCIQPAWSRKQWSEELAQYNMIKASAKLSPDNKQSIWWHFRKTLLTRLFGFGITTHIPITELYTPIQEVVLDNLLCLGVRKKWDITRSHGKLALRKWMNNHKNPDFPRTSGEALKKSIDLDFPISVLIWHFATEMCYFHRDNSTPSSREHIERGLSLIRKEHMKRDKQVSRELSNYIMYLVFRCGVKRTTVSQLVHDMTYKEMGKILSTKIQQDNPDEKDVVRVLFDEHKEVEPQHSSILRQHDIIVLLPSARDVARELIGITDDAERWRLIVEVWSEMLYYTAYHCGGAFHYEHLSTDGEFVTHVLLLMKILGPFLPPPAA